MKHISGKVALNQKELPAGISESHTHYGHAKIINSPIYSTSIIKFDKKTHHNYIHYAVDGSLFSVHSHATKIFPDDVMRTGKYMRTYLPYSGNTYFRTADVTDLVYTWCKENHIFKDSILYISFHGFIKKTTSGVKYGGVDISGYDAILYGDAIPAYLERVRLDSGVSISGIKAKIHKQFIWLNKNEHTYYMESIGKSMSGRPFNDIWHQFVNIGNGKYR